MLTRLHDIAQRAVTEQTARVLGWIIAVFSAALGVSVLIAPMEAVQRPSLVDAFNFAPPHIWAIGWIGLATWAGLTLYFKPAESALPLYLDGAIMAVFGWMTISPLVRGDGGIFGSWTFTALAACAILAGLANGDRR